MPAKRLNLFDCPLCNSSTVIKHITKSPSKEIIVRNHFCEKCKIMYVVAYSKGYSKLIDSYYPRKRIKIEEVIL